jgi:hypothetical protein
MNSCLINSDQSEKEVYRGHIRFDDETVSRNH